jgi:hypothetical protein
MLQIGILIFTTEPLYRDLELPHIPEFLSNYMTKTYGSIFTILPWFGYMAFGAFISTIFYRYLQRPRFKFGIITGFIIVGLFLINTSSYTLMKLYYWSDIVLFKEVAYFNYLYTRLGNVLVIFAVFYLFESVVKKPLILKIGQKTLSIYVIHFIIIWGSFTGFGLHQIIGKSLVPWQAILGAVIFLTAVCFISFHYAKTNAYVYSKLRIIIDKIKRI